MRGKLLLIYSILFLFVIFGYLFIYKLNKYNESIKVRDYKEIIDDRVLRVAVIKDSIYSDLFRSDNEKVYDFFKSINVEDSLIIEIYSFGTKTEALSELNNKKIDIVAINIPVTSDYNVMLNHIKKARKVCVVTDKFTILINDSINSTNVLSI